jgi:hypothetical protein
VQIFLAALFEEKLNKLLDQLNISRISGIRPYRISGRAIWYPAGYWISKKAGLSGRISGASLVKKHRIPDPFPLPYTVCVLVMGYLIPEEE